MKLNPSNISGDWLFVMRKSIQHPNRSGQRHTRPMRIFAFTLIELLVIAAVMAILLASAIPTMNKAKAKAKRITCVSHLKCVGLAYRIFSTDHGDQFPWQTNFPGSQLQPDEFLRYIVPLSNEFSTPLILPCPADTRKPARDWAHFSRENVSYFIGINAEETYPQSLLAGDRNLTTNGVRLGPGRVILDRKVNAIWDRTQHDSQGNAAMGDGSVQQLSSARMRVQLRNTGQTNTVLLFP
jgi:prepilin-type processing-associated H-X9-DG protein